MQAPDTPFLPTLRGYFETTIDDPTTDVAAAVDWRLKTVHYGNNKADFIEANYFSLAGTQVLDMACGWGGHAMAFASRGATVVASDLIDHAHEKLRAFCAAQGLPMDVHLADCQRTPFQGPFDVILALDLIEHIQEPAALANEIDRLLAPGGVCILTTPTKLITAIYGEPHWDLRGISLLPFTWQRPVAQKIFGRTYPYPLERQYWHAGQIQRLFGPSFKCQPIGAYPALASVAWKFFAITRR